MQPTGSVAFRPNYAPVPTEYKKAGLRENKIELEVVKARLAALNGAGSQAGFARRTFSDSARRTYDLRDPMRPSTAAQRVMNGEPMELVVPRIRSLADFANFQESPRDQPLRTDQGSWPGPSFNSEPQQRTAPPNPSHSRIMGNVIPCGGE